MNQVKNSYMDVNLLQREYYNPNKFTVIFTRDLQLTRYILASGKQLGPARAECKPDGFLYLPHGYYTVKGAGLPDGEKFDMVMNLEKLMFKGNKVPSNIRGLNA